MIEIAIGFTIALCVGLTGLGGGSFTTPVLVLFVGLPAAAAVGTALAFSAVLRMLAAPFHLVGRTVRAHCFWPLLLGGLPGLTVGIYFLRHMSRAEWSPRLLVALGLLLILTATASLWGPKRSLTRPETAMPGSLGAASRRKPPAWLALLALPIGLETGFSSAGSGALGVVALINFTDLTAAEAVGTDILFGGVLAIAGAGWSAGFGLTSGSTLLHLLMGGIPGVLLGCILGRRLPSRKLRALVMIVVLTLGVSLVWNGARAIEHGGLAPAPKAASAAPGLLPATPALRP